jgi:hypothetical protein
MEILLLPDHLITEILRKLDFDNLRVARTVCHKFRSIINNFITHLNVTSNLDLKLLDIFPNVSNMRIESYIVVLNLSNIVHFHKLKILDCSCYNLQNKDLVNIRKLPNLESLNLTT